MIRESYLCVMELLNFDNVVSQAGDDMLKIRLDRIVKDLTEAIKGYEQRIRCCNFASQLLVYTLSDSDEDLQAILNVISKYNKQALLFGYPHKGVILHQKPIDTECEQIKIYTSRALIEARAILANQNMASISIGKDLAKEKADIVERYTALFEQDRVMKILKAPLAKPAFDGIKSSLEKNFAKVGIDKYSAQSELLKRLSKFLEQENN